jgi:HEPN domain-containing protein
VTEARVVPCPPEEGRRFLRKAQRFLAAMERELAAKEFDPAGVNGVHAVIGACDALTSFRLGTRSRGQDHLEVLRLLLRCGVPASFQTQVREVLSKKRQAAYEATSLSRSEAEAIAQRARRVLAFVADLEPA